MARSGLRAKLNGMVVAVALAVGAIVVGAVGAITWAFVTDAAASSGPRSNDRTLFGTDSVTLKFKAGYQEVFKKDTRGANHKNYLYTVTSFTDSFGRSCTVVSGASEQTIAMDCADARQ